LDGVVEMGTLRGNEVSLPAHFHHENQITFVISGRRRFILGREVMTLLPGQDALIAAGVVHRFLSEPSGTDCLNVYVPAGEYNVAAMVRDAEHVWSKLRPCPTISATISLPSAA
jgi:mannose-6-phosphate isomerase-like protein (cupin superfamily)